MNLTRRNVLHSFCAPLLAPTVLAGTAPRPGLTWAGLDESESVYRRYVSVYGRYFAGQTVEDEEALRHL